MKVSKRTIKKFFLKKWGLKYYFKFPNIKQKLIVEVPDLRLDYWRKSGRSSFNNFLFELACENALVAYKGRIEK